MGINVGSPPNDRIDYDRAGRLEQAIRAAAHKYLFTVVDVVIRTHDDHAPTMEIELRQQPGQVRDDD